MRTTAIAAGLAALFLPLQADAGPKRRETLENLAPWAVDPDRVKLEIIERLVLEKAQYEKALPIIAAMRKEGVKAPVLDLLQGIALREGGMRGEAETMLIEARRRMPSDPRVHDALCVLYADQQELDKAIGACEKATRIDNENASAWNNLGYLYVVTDRAPEAIEAGVRAMELDAAEPRYRNNLAMAHVLNGDTDHALELFRSTGSEADAYYNVGFATERSKGRDAALEWYRRALDANARHLPSNDAVERLTLSKESQESP